MFTVLIGLYDSSCIMIWCVFFFFFQAEDGIRDLVRSRGLGDVYKRQPPRHTMKKSGSRSGVACAISGVTGGRENSP